MRGAGRDAGRANDGSAPPRWSKAIPWMFVGGFAVVIAVNGALIYFAQSSFSGLETEHAYERGLHYNQALEAAAQQERLGWRAEIAFADAGGDGRELAVNFADRLDRPIDGLDVKAYLVRPSNAGMDLALPLDGQGNGRYAAKVILPAPGQWDIRVVARDEQNSWQRTERLLAR